MSLSFLSLWRLESGDTKVHEPYVRARLETVSHFCEVVVFESYWWQVMDESSVVAAALKKAGVPDGNLTECIR